MKFVKSAAMVLGLLVVASSQASAADPVAGAPARFNGIGVGLVIIGAAYGIGKLTASAVESMARQPEIAANIQTAMIISAALIEGVAFFAIIVLGFIIAPVEPGTAGRPAEPGGGTDPPALEPPAPPDHPESFGSRG